MVEAARRIGAEDLSRRLTAETGDDELARLAGVLNDMLGRLEGSFAAARQFSADAAHELRTPLTILRGELDVALAAAPHDAPHRRALESCLEEVGRLSSLVEDLLFLARADAGADPPPSDRVDLAQLVGDAAPALEALAARGGAHLEIAAAPAPARGSAPLLFRVVFNLVDNAITHGGAGARVSVATGTDGDRAVLAVCDDGPGIPPAARERIFDRFHRGDPARARGGAGLGLAITKAIVDLHRGAIAVAVEPRTCFRVTLPRDAP
jgi:two-component system heavy metal sensor histidine kinase CusS